MTFNLFKSRLSIPLNFTHSRSFDDKSPHQSDSENFNYSLAVTFAITQNQKLSVNGSLAQFKDKVNANADYDQYAVTASYNATL